MAEQSWLDIVTAIGAVATPILVLGLTGVGWRIRESVERRRTAEERLSDERVEIYKKVLEPFFILLMPDAAWDYDRKRKNKDKIAVAMGIMYSIEYRQVSAHLSLIGSDGVVKAYNELMQYVFHSEAGGDLESAQMLLSKLGGFLLAIRRSVGNEETDLDNWAMMEWFITDAATHRELSP